MKRHASAILLAAALVVLAFWLRGRDERGGGAALLGGPREKPEDVIDGWFDAAQRGDDAGYLARVGGELRRELEATRAEAGRDAFRAELRRSARGIKGIAVTRAGQTPEGCVWLEVEIVHADRNERQRMRLEPSGPGWVIARVERATRVEPPVPWGTPVFAGGGEREAPPER